MALKYKLIQRKKPGDHETPGKFYPQLVSNGRVSFGDLCEEIAEQSSLTSGDVKNCLDRLVYCLSRRLKDGQSVDAGDLGSYSVTLRSGGSDTAEEYDPLAMMRCVNVRYTPGRKLREMRRNDMRYERVDDGE